MATMSTANVASQNSHLLSAEKLPSWADISSLSDEELFALYDSCEQRFPQLSSVNFKSVCRIASDAVMKAGGIMQHVEPVTMSLVRGSTTILLPTVLRSLNANGRLGFIMDYIPGQTVAQCWSRLGLWQRFRLCWTIRGYIRQLRRVVIPGITRSELFPGPIGDEPQLCYGPMFSHDYGGGPFASYEELTTWFMHKLDVNRNIRKTPTEDITFDSSLPLVLTHLDISPHNVVVDNNSRIWLIDWEFAGFYPQWFEYVAMRSTWEIAGRWKRWIIGFMAGFYERQTRFISEIGWAIGTGHFL
ncbi:kinase-like domain-containing protein [Dichomitus squalens]|uniref:Kinase-like domain-containing protein n=2 Tax=Dichomitus squalens TaxID=114155 RepID=A0A4V6MWD9_9APHY|nr:uncharacterized protein DICSQDRAFT_107130 [Dichomitus squalens LYAD-421 SS1]EJF60726.1 hypothetical protein DICSQDRAFT_107130 [Dichomitus squalens LYAD-421 SS1]TBU27869.1 kinase-like domain-containing protein [Dichomitus squalens]TBU44403.1 kinase-like domain-containing protein [Dichomitus squalens]TBU55876.1 kinase-like domain-containing protein [Dichomitus squalens]